MKYGALFTGVTIEQLVLISDFKTPRKTALIEIQCTIIRDLGFHLASSNLKSLTICRI